MTIWDKGNKLRSHWWRELGLRCLCPFVRKQLSLFRYASGSSAWHNLSKLMYKSKTYHSVNANRCKLLCDCDVAQQNDFCVPPKSCVPLPFSTSHLCIHKISRRREDPHDRSCFWVLLLVDWVELAGAVPGVSLSILVCHSALGSWTSSWSLQVALLSFCCHVAFLAWFYYAVLISSLGDGCLCFEPVCLKLPSSVTHKSSADVLSSFSGIYIGKGLFSHRAGACLKLPEFSSFTKCLRHFLVSPGYHERTGCGIIHSSFCNLALHCTQLLYSLLHLKTTDIFGVS